jgi:hypothetical protein
VYNERKGREADGNDVDKVGLVNDVRKLATASATGMVRSECPEYPERN